MKKENALIKKCYFIFSARNSRSLTWFADTLKEIEDFNVEMGERKFEIDNYITGALNNEQDVRSQLVKASLNVFFSQHQKCILTGLGTQVHFSRPDLKNIFKNISSAHPDVPEIGVFFCGPEPLANSIDSSLRPYDKKFKFYKENF